MGTQGTPTQSSARTRTTAPVPSANGWVAALLAALVLAVIVLAGQLVSLRTALDAIQGSSSSTADTGRVEMQLADVCSLLGAVAGAQKVHQVFSAREDLGDCERAAAAAAGAAAPGH